MGQELQAALELALATPLCKLLPKKKDASVPSPLGASHGDLGEGADMGSGKHIKKPSASMAPHQTFPPNLHRIP